MILSNNKGDRKMKKKIKVIFTVVLSVALISVLASCNMSDFARLTSEFKSLLETLNSLDEVALEDINAMDPNDLSLTFDIYGDLLLGAESLNGPPFSEENHPGLGQGALQKAEKVANILILREQIRTRTQNLKAINTELRAEIATLRDLVRELDKENFEISEEERAILREYIDELKDIRGNLNQTIGKAYKRMNNLRGKYNINNIDHIESEFQGVNAVLQVREDNLERIKAIIEDLKEMLIERQSDEIE